MNPPIHRTKPLIFFFFKKSAHVTFNNMQNVIIHSILHYTYTRPVNIYQSRYSLGIILLFVQRKYVYMYIYGYFVFLNIF